MVNLVCWYTGMAISIQLERDRAYERLTDMILHGDVDFDTPLSERKLADRLEMGRTPVREALRDLAHDGVVEVRVARGVFVRRLSGNDLQKIYEAREALEGKAAYLAAKHGSTAELSAFRQQLQEIATHPDRFGGAAIDDAGAEFHLEIFKAARNETLLRLFKTLRLRFLIAFGMPRDYDPAGMLESVSEHLALLDAIEAGESAKAQRLMCAHLERGLEVRTRMFGNREHDKAREHPPGPGNK
jgi:DNA-binding GntR family transcriptional regulator